VQVGDPQPIAYYQRTTGISWVTGFAFRLQMSSPSDLRGYDESTLFEPASTAHQKSGFVTSKKYDEERISNPSRVNPQFGIGRTYHPFLNQ
jgi:hypothetical protein